MKKSERCEVCKHHVNRHPEQEDNWELWPCNVRRCNCPDYENNEPDPFMTFLGGIVHLAVLFTIIERKLPI